MEWGGLAMALVIIWVKLREAYKEMARDLTESDGAGEAGGGDSGSSGGEGIKEAENH